jgi:hypothetical protein
MTVNTLAEATAELGRLTNRSWLESELLEYCSQNLITLLAKVVIDESDVRVLQQKAKAMSKLKNATHQQVSIWQSPRGQCLTFAELPAEAAWMLREEGIAEIRHPAAGRRSWPVRQVKVYLDSVRVPKAVIQKISSAYVGAS